MNQSKTHLYEFQIVAAFGPVRTGGVVSWRKRVAYGSVPPALTNSTSIWRSTSTALKIVEVVDKLFTVNKNIVETQQELVEFELLLYL